MWGRLFLFALIVAAGLSAAAAQDIGALIAEYTKGQTELGQVEKRAEELVQEHKSDERAYQSHIDKQNQLETRIEEVTHSFQEHAGRQVERSNQIVENWNSQCSVDRVGMLEEGAYNRCAGLRSGVIAESEGIRAAIEKEGEDIQRTQIDPLIKLIELEHKAINEIALRSEQRQAEFERLKEASERIARRLEQIQSQLGSECPSAPTDELASFCSSLGFDRAASNPGQFSDSPLQPAPFSATPNR